VVVVVVVVVATVWVLVASLWMGGCLGGIQGGALLFYWSRVSEDGV